MAARRRQQRKIMQIQDHHRQLRNERRPNPTLRLAHPSRIDLRRELYTYKIDSILSADQRQEIQDYITELEQATGKFYSLYVSRRINSGLPSYHDTIHIGGIGFRGPITVTMIPKYAKYNGVYPSVFEFQQQVLSPLYSKSIQPMIDTGLLVDSTFSIDASIFLTIRSHGYSSSTSVIIGSISSSINGRKIGSLDEVPIEFLQKLEGIRAGLSTEDTTYDLYWVQGLDHGSDIVFYSPIHPHPKWSESTKINLFNRALFERAIRFRLPA